MLGRGIDTFVAMYPRTERAETRTVGIGTLLTLLLSLLIIEGIPVLHAHAAAQPAIYNAECVLAGLAAHTAGAPLPAAVSVATPLAVTHAPDLPLPPVPPSPLYSPADPRAPPSAR